MDAAAGANSNSGGGYIAQGEYRVTVRGLGLVQSIQDIENIVVSAQKGTPVRVRDIGSVKIGIAGGSFESGGATVTLQKNKPLTLMNTADGTRYVLRLISIG